LLDHATAFYRDLFGPTIDYGIRTDDDIWSPEEKIDDLEREVMDRAFSEEEIKILYI
jgi:negative regulator of genetic competence, sporulation and motility